MADGVSNLGALNRLERERVLAWELDDNTPALRIEGGARIHEQHAIRRLLFLDRSKGSLPNTLKHSGVQQGLCEPIGNALDRPRNNLLRLSGSDLCGGLSLRARGNRCLTL